MSGVQMRDYWDERADEDPFYFVDSQLTYRNPDVERFWAAGEEVLDEMLERLEVEMAPGDDAVEIGCGLGRITRALAHRVASVRALDISGRMIERARELNADLENVEWLVGDGSTLAPLADGSADVCHSYVVFQHLPHPELTYGYVHEMARVLRPGGVAFFQVSNAPEVHRLRRPLERLQLAAQALLGRGPRGQMDPSWRGSAVDLGTLRNVAEAACMPIDRTVGEGTMFCMVSARRTETPATD